MRAPIRTTLALLAAGAFASAQEPPRREGSVQEEVVVERVVVDAYVTGADGNPIPDLTEKDFRIRVDGRAVAVESAEWLPAGKAETDASALVGTSPEETARWVADTPPGRLIVMFFQTDNSQISRVHGLMRMGIQARMFLDTLLPSDRVAVLSFDSQLKLRQDFTADKKKISDAIHSAIRTGPAPPPDPASQPSIARYLDAAAARQAAMPERAMALLASALEPIPGGKSLLYFGFGFGTIGGVSGPVAAEQYAWSDALQAMAQSRVSVFTLDIADADYHTLEVSLQAMADLTGGKYEKTHLFPSLAMKRVQQAIAGRYVLVFVKPGFTRGEHTISIELTRQKGRVFSRQYYED